MAVCKSCKREMLTAKGCSEKYIFQNGRDYLRIKVGAPEDMRPIKKGERCPDCNAKYGYFHHLYCDGETCPICKKQMLICNCENIEVYVK
ncbi:putative uncharacterized protein [Lachnospiraceae bacterium CAG:364]|nr:putative uncharacterized protein [Lachnospiraceae bacterium CAG:364]